MPANAPHDVDAAETTSIPRDRQFVHLHLHTEYSLLDGGNRIDRLIDRVAELGMTSVAVTDHGNLFGAVSFFEKARARGVKPILGCEAYVAPGDRTDRAPTGVQDGGFHLVLLAENETGWRNLVYLASEAYLTGFYYKPRMDRSILQTHGDGLIAIEGHLGSEVAYHLDKFVRMRDASCMDAAREALEWRKRVFTPGEKGPRLYVELQHHIPEQNAINPLLIELAREYDLPLVATNDSHFLRAEDHDAHDTLVCISTGKVKNDESRMRYPKALYVKSPAEMREVFESAYGEDGRVACDNTVAIAEQCDLELTYGDHAPVVRAVTPEAPEPYRGEADLTEWFKRFSAGFAIEPASDDEDLDTLKRECDEALRTLCEGGLIWRYGGDFAPGAPEPKDEARRQYMADVRARLDRELQVLIDKSITPYFLVVWDFVNWGRQRGVPAMARGSGVGTMVGYLLGLSNACPVKYGLLFERFTDPDRAEYPDIDIDLCQNGRAEVIDFVRQKYGHVAQIITFGTMKARAAIRDVGRVLNVPLSMVDRIAKLVPGELNITLDKAMEQEPDLRALYEGDAKAIEQATSDPTLRAEAPALIRQLIDNARTLEGQARHASVHAAGVILATRPLHEIVPLYKAPNSEDIVTQWDGPTCERIGLLKMDFLGLRTLSIIERCRQLVRESLDDEAVHRAVGRDVGDGKPHPLDLERLTYDDPRVFQLFERADTTGVFQFESGGMRRLLLEMRPDRLEDLIAANALYRPGPMDLIPDYNARKHGQKAVPQVHPIVDRFTEDTYGVMVYQEQVMQIVHELGDIPLRAAYTLIKAISKKKAKVIDANRPKFIEGAQQKGLSRDKADELFELILKFAGYGFNKSHSTAYAIVAYQTAYLKTYFPNQYMAAFLTFESQAQKTSDWIPYLEDCKRVVFADGKVGVEVRPPDINLSNADFSVVFGDDEARDALGGHVRFGLKAIKGVGGRAIESIVQDRQEAGPFTSLYDFCERVSAVNKATIEALVKAGVFDSVHGRDARSDMVASIEQAVAAGQAMARDRAAGQGGLFLEPDGAAEEAPTPEPPLARGDTWDELETLAGEKEALGFYVSSHPLDAWRTEVDRYATNNLLGVPSAPHDSPVVVGAMVSDIRLRVTRNGRSAGQKFAIVTLEDWHGMVEAVLFADAYSRYANLLAQDAIVFVAGRVDLARGAPQIVVDHVAPIENAAPSMAERLDLRLDPAALGEGTRDALKMLRGLLLQHSASAVDTPGTPVHLLAPMDDPSVANGSTRWARLECTMPDKVALSRSLLDQLARDLGACNVMPRPRPAASLLQRRPAWKERQASAPKQQPAGVA